MALGAVDVEDRFLNEALVAERLADPPAGRGQFHRGLAHGDADLGARGGAVAVSVELLLVAAGAAALLPRHYVGERTHDINRHAVLVEHLEEDRLAGGNLEVDASVGLDRDGAQNALHPLGLEDRDGRAVVLDGLVPGGVGLRIHLDHADRLPLLFENRGGVLKDVVAVKNPRGRLGADTDFRPVDHIGLERLDPALTQGACVVGVVLTGVDQFFIAVDIHKVQVEEPLVIVAAVKMIAVARRNEEVLFRKGIGRLIRVVLAADVVVVLRGRVFRAVPDLGPGDLAGDPLKTVGIVQAEVRVDRADRAVEPGVMPQRGEHHLCGAGDRAPLGQDVGPDRLVPPERLGIGPVGVHRPERLNAPQGFIGVFPAGVQNPAVGEHRGEVFRLAVGRDDVDVLAVGVAAGHGERVGHRHAADITVLTARTEDNLPFGGVDRVKVVVVAVGQLLEIGTVEIALVQVERFFPLRLEAEQKLFGVVRQVGTPEAPLVPGQNVLNLAAGVQADDQHAAARGRHIAVAVTGLVPPLVGRVPRFPVRVGVVDQNHLVEVDQGVFKDNAALDGAHRQVELLGRFGGLLRVGVFFLELVERGEIVVETHLVVELLQALGHLARPGDLLTGTLEGRLIVALEEPVGLQLLAAKFGQLLGRGRLERKGDRQGGQDQKHRLPGAEGGGVSHKNSTVVMIRRKHLCTLDILYFPAGECKAFVRGRAGGGRECF